MAKRTVSVGVAVEGEEQYKKSMEGLAKSNERLGGSTGKLGDQVQSLSGKLGINLPSGATKALNSMDGFSAGTIAKMGAVAGAVAVAIKAIKALYDTTIEAAAKADELLTKSAVTGLSTDTLQQWEYASQFVDVSVETMTGSMSKLTRAMAEAQAGNGATAEAFKALGVEVTNADGSLRSTEDVFYDAIDALQGVGNQAERDALTMEIFGRSAQELNPLILQGSDALKELGDEAEKTGYVLDEYQVKKLGEVDDAYQQMKLQLDATKTQLAVAFAPIAKTALEGVTKAVEVLTNAIRKMNEMTEKATNAVKNLLGLAGPQQGYGGLGSDIAGATWHDDVQAWVSAGGTIIDASNVNDFDKTTGKLTRQFYYSPEWMTGDVASYGYMSEDELRRLMGYNASGNDNWRGGLTYLNEAGPEAVFLPSGSQILSAQETRMLGAGGNTYNINVQNVEELQQLLDLLDGLRVRRRMG